eukprot:3647183-Prymnesium_polylepis.1
MGRARPELAVQLLQLGTGRRSSAAAEGGECVRARWPWAMCDRRSIALRSQLCVWTPGDALTRWASSSRAGRQGRFSWAMLASLSRACVSSVTYVQ